ncbi:Phosphate-selective porin O and P [Lishizhenia tianjinensis]|uniref:Phosphate-selective porin O and P n=1 Tax=Lishizhenia tianjinensis TaxID=477690 RepID=A0A1I7B3S3_9FLAO|nr:porin [Lishizhenia tianjinensis]SFT81839.1 Phosphate-selective porin O and P [Lishizhenia tianjinensis]
MRSVLLAVIVLISATLHAQVEVGEFGKGINVTGKNESFSMNLGFRFQTLMTTDWTVNNDDFGQIDGFTPNLLIRRSRIKMKGHVYSPKLTYKVELALSDRDIAVGDEPLLDTRIVLDAVFKWNFYKNFSLWGGQTKLPGNRERVVSSANMQLVDRSILNSRFNIDRDLGLQLRNHNTLGGVVIKEMFAISKGEGRNIRAANLGGLEYTGRVEILPFGNFSSKGDYVGSSIKREKKPKLALGFTYDLNERAVKNRGNMGSFVRDAQGNFHGKNVYTFFADMMFKYQGWSLMAEYADRWTNGNNPLIYSGDVVIGTIFTGKALNVQAGYMFKNNVEVAARYAGVDTPDVVKGDQQEYRIGVSKYFVGHKLKVQTDIGYLENRLKDDGLTYRLQFEIHF